MLQITRYSVKVVEKRRRREKITKRFAFEANTRTLSGKLHLPVKNLALNLMLTIGPNLNTNMMLFIFVNIQNKIVLTTFLESSRRISAQIIDHGGRDQKSYIFTHAVINEHCIDSYDDFEVVLETPHLKEMLLKTC